MARSKGNFKSCRITVLIKESITAGACCCMPVDFCVLCVCACVVVVVVMLVGGGRYLGKKKTAGLKERRCGGWKKRKREWSREEDRRRGSERGRAGDQEAVEREHAHAQAKRYNRACEEGGGSLLLTVSLSLPQITAISGKVRSWAGSLTEALSATSEIKRLANFRGSLSG